MKPEYQIIRLEDTAALSPPQLTLLLEKLPFSFKISKGQDLSLESRLPEPEGEQTLIAEHGASLISLKPPKGKRLSDGCFYGKHSTAFSPSRVMDECTGGGACCSYSFNTKELGLPFDQDLMLDIYKLG